MPDPMSQFAEWISRKQTTDSSLEPTGLGAGPSGYGQYDQLFAANPYRNLTYNQSGWQKFLSSLGFRTKYDDFVEQAQVNAAEYDAGIFSMMQQNEFNSPVEQAERMRAAGQNPDMLGIGDVASAASPVEDPNGMQMEPTNELEPLTIVSSVSSHLMNMIPSVMSFATQLSQLRGIRLENDAKELSFSQSAVDAASKFFTESITPDDYKQAFEKNDWTNILDAAKKDASYLGELLLSDKKARKRFNYAYNVHSRSLVGLMQKYQSYDEFEKNRKSLLEQRANPFFSDDDDAMQSLLNSFLGPLGEYQKRMAEIDRDIANLRDPELEQGLTNTQLSNQQLYENAIDPQLQAETENEANRFQKQQSDIQAATDKLFADIMKSLESKDNWWSKIGMALVGIARAQLLSGLHLQFGRNQSYQSSDSYSKNGQSHSAGHSSGFHFGF